MDTVTMSVNATASPAYQQSLQVPRPAALAAAANASPLQQSHYNWSRHPDMDIIEDAGVQAFFFICYTTIFVLGVFGNVLVCYVVGRNRAMQTVTNFFITNLALSDILLCILAVPFTPLYSFVGRWVFGQVMCHLVTYAQGTSVYISTLTLTSIAIDRYFVIIYPFQPRMKQSTCLFIILGIWTFSLVVTVPYGLYMSFNDTYCEEAWPSENFRQIYSGVTTVLQFLVPLVVIAFAYICVSVRLSDHARLKPGCKSSRKEEADRERKRRTNRMLIAMVTVFGLSWMPLNVINLVNDIHMSIGNWRYYNLVFFTVHALAMSSTCYNPFLYAWLNDNFRKEFKQVLPCFVRFGLSQPGCNPASATTQSTAPWRSEAACNGGGAPPRTASARAGQGGGGLHHANHGHGPGPEAHDALLPAAPRRPRCEEALCSGATAPPPASNTTIRASRAGQQALHQLRGKRKEPSTSSPTTEAVSWTGACMGSSTNLGDLVTATYSTEDGSVEVHLPLEAVVLAANSPSSPPGGASPGAASPTGMACSSMAGSSMAGSSIAVAPPERPLISISPEGSPRNHAAVSRAMSAAGAAAAAAAGPGPAVAAAAVDNGANGSLRLLVTSPGSATVA